MTNPVALVTGASRGIGKAAAIALARSGFDVAISARTMTEGQGRDDSDTGHGRAIAGSLEATAIEIEAVGRRALPVRMDILDRATLGAGVDRVLREWGRIDVLVNNAVHTGAGSMTLLADLTLAVFETKLEGNVIAPLILCQAVLPGMIHRGGGTIVNVTSAVAYSDPPAPAGKGGWGAAYAMSKGAMHRLAGFLAVEHRNDGIFACNVQPGFVVTERMEENQEALGLQSFKGAPPSVPGDVIAWLATQSLLDGHGDAADLNGTTVEAQPFALQRGIHADWRPPRTSSSARSHEA